VSRGGEKVANVYRDRAMLIASIFALIGVAMLVTGFISTTVAQSYTVTLNSNNNFDWRVSGYIEYIYTGTYATSIPTSSGSISINPGDRVRIVVNTVNQGYIWFGSDGYLTIQNLPVQSIYINNNPVASNTIITNVANMPYDINTVNSTLNVYVSLVQGNSYGWLKLSINGNTIVSQWNYDGYVIVYSVGPSSTQSLNLNIGGRYLEGVAEGIETPSNTIGVSELSLPGIAISMIPISMAIYRIYRKGYR